MILYKKKCISFDSEGKALSVHFLDLGDQADQDCPTAARVPPERLVRLFGQNRYLPQFHFQKEPRVGYFPETIHKILSKARLAYFPVWPCFGVGVFPSVQSWVGMNVLEVLRWPGEAVGTISHRGYWAASWYGIVKWVGHQWTAKYKSQNFKFKTKKWSNFTWLMNS